MILECSSMVKPIYGYVLRPPLRIAARRDNYMSMMGQKMGAIK